MPAVNQRYLIKFGELIDKNKVWMRPLSWSTLKAYHRSLPTEVHQFQFVYRSSLAEVHLTPKTLHFENECNIQCILYTVYREFMC